jgi:anti-sigma regulatory factor (Ser/Thr protein kinase)
MEELALHILDIAENSIAAGARHVTIRVSESRREDKLTIEIADDGRGMTQGAHARALDPFYTTRTTRRVGLGLPLFAQAAEAGGGEFSIHSEPGVGTRVVATFELGHPDRQPLGDLASTVLALVVGNPEVDFNFEHEVDGARSNFSSLEIKQELAGAPLNSAAGIAAVQRRLEELETPPLKMSETRSP